MNSTLKEKEAFPYLGFGVGLRPPHYSFVLESHPQVDWFEVITENFMGQREAFGGRPLQVLEQVRKDYEVAFHGVSLSIGSASSLDPQYLKRLKTLVERFKPAWVSDHLCWTGIDGVNLHDLLPLPFTEEVLDYIVSRVIEVQEYLSRPILLENVSSYLEYEASAIPEWEFLSEVATRSGCGILLDINNVYVSSVNHGFDPNTYLEGIASHHVFQFHIAGYTDCKTYLFDTHDHAISDPVWNLYQKAVRRFGKVSTLLERDSNIPEFSALLEELNHARRITDGLFEK